MLNSMTYLTNAILSPFPVSFYLIHKSPYVCFYFAFFFSTGISFLRSGVFRFPPASSSLQSGVKAHGILYRSGSRNECSYSYHFLWFTTAITEVSVGNVTSHTYSNTGRLRQLSTSALLQPSATPP